MKHCYAIGLQKGGVGKTTTAIALADTLARRGYKVLAIDFEPQANLTLNYKGQEHEPTIYEVLTGEAEPQAAIVTTENGPDVMAGSQELYIYEPKNIKALKGIIDALAPKYDYFVIDTPPNFGALVTLSLAAADRVIIPAGADRYGIEAVTQFYEGIFTGIKRELNQELKISGVLLNRYKNNSVNKLARQTLEFLAKGMHTKVFESTIREAVDVQKAQYMCEPLAEIAPRSKVLQDFEDFVTEILADD